MTADNYKYYDGKITVPQTFKELSDIICEYETTAFADAAIDGFQYWDVPYHAWPTKYTVDTPEYNVACKIRNLTHNFNVLLNKGGLDVT